MNILNWLILAVLMFSPLTAHADSPVLAGVGLNPTAGNQDTSQANDPPVIAPRFHGSQLVDYLYKAYDSDPILLGPVGPSPSTPVATKTVVGAHTVFGLATNDPNVPAIEVEHYYQSLIQKAGGAVAFSCDNASCGTGGMNDADACLAFAKRFHPDDTDSSTAFEFDHNSNDTPTECHFFVGFIPAAGSDGDIYISVFVYDLPGGSIQPFFMIDIVETSNVSVKTIHLDADQMASDLTTTGKVDIYGIYFDTDKSDLKPESADALQQIAKLLGNEPDLHVLIVGHTDNQGDFQYNIGLSQRRAQAVEQALVNTYHIDPSRLTPFGDGMTAPVATNRTDAGRALNRRVEIVED